MLAAGEEAVRLKAEQFLEELRIIPGADFHILGELARALPHPLTALRPMGVGAREKGLKGATALAMKYKVTDISSLVCIHSRMSYLPRLSLSHSHLITQYIL